MVQEYNHYVQWKLNWESGQFETFYVLSICNDNTYEFGLWMCLGFVTLAECFLQSMIPLVTFAEYILQRMIPFVAFAECFMQSVTPFVTIAECFLQSVIPFVTIAECFLQSVILLKFKQWCPSNLFAEYVEKTDEACAIKTT